jgi:hypothetical protein
MPAPTYSFTNLAIKSDGNLSYRNLTTELTNRITAANTLLLDNNSSGNQVFTGTVSGQIVNLGDATNYGLGHEWWIVNQSTTSISILRNDGTSIATIPASSSYRFLLTNNSTSNGSWVSTLARVGGASSAVLVAMFSQTANAINAGFLDTENIAPSNTVPAVAPISGIISLLAFTGAGSTPSGSLEIRVNTTVGTAAAVVTLAGTQTQVSPINIQINAGDRLSCSVAGGSGISKPLVKLYL